MNAKEQAMKVRSAAARDEVRAVLERLGFDVQKANITFSGGGFRLGLEVTARDAALEDTKDGRVFVELATSWGHGLPASLLGLTTVASPGLASTCEGLRVVGYNVRKNKGVMLERDGKRFEASKEMVRRWVTVGAFPGVSAADLPEAPVVLEPRDTAVRG